MCPLRIMARTISRPASSVPKYENCYPAQEEDRIPKFKADTGPMLVVSVVFRKRAISGR